MRIVFYCMFGVIGLLGVYFVSSSLYGYYQYKIALIAGAIVAAKFLHMAYEVGELQQRWAAGCGLVLAALVSFQAIQVVEMVGVEFLKKLSKS
jgi:hypothetical protein